MDKATNSSPPNPQPIRSDEFNNMAAENFRDLTRSSEEHMSSPQGRPIRAIGGPRIPVDSLDFEGMRELQRQISERPSTMHASDAPMNQKAGDVELGSIDPDNFDMRAFLSGMVDRSQENGNTARTLPLCFTGLTVRGRGSGVEEGADVGSLLNPFHAFKRLTRDKKVVKDIVTDVTGFVRPGEMLIVAGIPGSGCTTLLKTLVGHREGYQAVLGDVSYGGWSIKEIETFLRGDAVYCGEEDVHFPTLTVQQTFEFACAARTPPSSFRAAMIPGASSRRSFIQTFEQVIGTVLGLRRVFDTKVGNELIRGISGGQKKRVSIGEVLATHAKILAFDNSTRGLDASTAGDFIKALRIGTDIAQLVTMAVLYQAGDHIVRMFDKVTVLYSGHQVFFGTVDQGLDYFHELGFERRFGQSVGDFFVAVTDPASRHIREGYQSVAPLTAKDMAAAWKRSELCKELERETAEYAKDLADRHAQEADGYRRLTANERAKHQRQQSRYTITYGKQIRLAFGRRYRMVMGDLTTHLVPLMSNTFSALITGSVFYDSQPVTSSLFSRSGVLFFALLLNALSAMTEVSLGYAARPILIRQANFGMIRPSADAIANSILMIPIKLLQMIPFVIIIYFMTGLTRTADAFFIFFGTISLTTFTIGAFFRMLAALLGDESLATTVAGLAVLDFTVYTGYTIPRPSMVVWWRWLSYCNPLAFAFEILLTNEFRNLDSLECAQLIPAGPGYANIALANRVCPVAGSAPGEATVNAANYAAQQYGYYFSNAPRNAGILFGFWFGFMIIQAIAVDRQKDPLASGGATIFKSGAIPEPESLDSSPLTSSEQPDEKAVAKVSQDSGNVFAWEDVVYEVPVEGGTRRLLNKVTGYVRPGTLTALMGESGAGKTTLLNVLAERTDSGTVTGSRTINGLPLGASFQGDTGYCQQQDNHLATSTVRESLEFSALLRQPAATPRAEKLAYVDEVIKMLQMENFQHAMVGVVGQGLSVEQRKRLTIGVELAAKPQLLFLDEPTSGLSAQASWSIIQFLRQLANAGQAIICTIHQPSGELINEFDRLLLLRRGGETVFFGDLGKNCSNMVEYFSTHSNKQCEESDNPAEYMLDVIAEPPSGGVSDWHQVYLQSRLETTLQSDMAEIRSVHHGKPADHEDPKPATEFAASLGEQSRILVKRTALHFWRSPNYIMSKMALNVFAGLFIGSSFWNAGGQTSTASLQNKTFAVFMALILSTSQAQQTQSFFLVVRDLYDAREKPSKAYSWVAMLTSFIVLEIAYNLVTATLFWIPWYYMVQFDTASNRAAYSWGVIMLFSMYWATFAIAIASMAATAATASLLFSTFFSFVLIFCGVAQPPPQLPTFWRSWMVPLSPFTYMVMGLLGNTLDGQEVRCTDSEYSIVNPPSDQTCDAFLGPFASAGRGYFVTRTDGSCGYCPYSEGNDYWSQFTTSTFPYSSSYRYRNIGIVCAFIGFNFFLMYALFWLFRVRKSSGKPSLLKRLLAKRKSKD